MRFDSECPEKLEITNSFTRGGRMFLSLGPSGVPKEGPADLGLLEFRVREPQVHGALGSTPDNVAELAARLEKMGEELQPRLSEWARAGALGQSPKATPLIVVSVPKIGEEGSAPKEWEYWAFTTRGTVTDLAVDLGQILVEPDGRSYQRIPNGIVAPETVKLDPMRLVKRLTRAEARLMSGYEGDETRLVAVGAGAIGSNVIVNGAHTGFATWTIIDNDVVLPHNTVRQHLGNDGVGHPKAAVTTGEVNFLLQESSAKFIVADVLDEGDKAEAIANALGAADVTIDFSASPAVLGNLTDRAEPRRLVSMFFNPGGDQLVVLAEDSERRTRLDELEAQYYWAVAAFPQLAGHLDDGRLGFLRYANACHDLSRPLPPWQVQTLSGIGAKRLLDLTSDASASAKIWQLDPETGSIRALELPACGVHRFEGGGFRISLSRNAVRSMTQLRAESLPNETGGVLIGSFDATRKIVHVVGVLPAPPDSEQRPTYFVRGKKDLLPAVEAIGVRTVNNLHYLGEWHSHPKGAATTPSGDDRNVFDFLTGHLAPTGQPFGMVICGDDDLRLLFGWNEMRLEDSCGFDESA
ncbi:proteasome lid subunit RPN8/RPN11 [Bosea sp. BE271]|uniref:Mov34/MPN/PAD-1 family protein n=1 Tax=Bosea TaxID=85413 RepID=UPI002863CAB6|nr:MULTISPECIES: Mov34/MPN/PAD-1 family protein [Bosea]MDR6831496.1 proteasome lid subunit RPN8/RPN11 [Bosea robiniae]MDR6898205.1 proteasome lid subunit RPN8/RPN11 [Bosea sp. BE109]MDR7141602.1 proteasome lid subunit RPN8/RPN11 [Bosea sp. BE168]MDR7178254.1 proteasome lid subunit RPN8/RPN11 [Bosea sp. BE271]